MRTTHFWNNIYHVQAQNLKIGKPNKLKVFRNNAFKQKQTNKKLKQKETQKTTNNQKPKTKTKKQKTKHTSKNKRTKISTTTKKQTIKQKKRLKMKGGDPNLEKFTYILYQSSGVNLT